jgi:ABC-2 type transport system permease protein
VRGARSNLLAALSVLRRDLRLALSYRLQLASAMLAGFFTLTIFYYVSRLVHVGAFESSDDYYSFVVVGIVILQMLNSVMAGPPLVLRQELVAGTFERFVLSPFGPVAGLASLMLFPLVLALVTGALMLSFGVIVFGVDLEPTAALAIPVAILGALAFAPFGALLVAVVLIVKQAALGATWVITAISLVAGLYFPVALLPGWIQWASHVQPFTPAVDLLRHLLVGTPLEDPAWLDLVKLLGFTAATLPLALGGLAAAVGFARRRGTIIEY